MIKADKVYVLHVKKGYEERATHMGNMLKAKGIDFQYILDGDIDDLSTERLSQYFKGNMVTIGAETSCAMKHVLCYKDMIENNIKNALILEDDIFLDKNFVKIFNKTIDEVQRREDIDEKKILISYENTRLRYIPRSKRVKNQFLYREIDGRMTGAYLVTRDSAKAMLEELEKEKTNLPIDHYHALLMSLGILHSYWCQPTIAEQGSHSSSFISGIQKKKATNMANKIKWNAKKTYKKALYFFR